MKQTITIAFLLIFGTKLFGQAPYTYIQEGNNPGNGHYSWSPFERSDSLFMDTYSGEFVKFNHKDIILPSLGLTHTISPQKYIITSNDTGLTKASPMSSFTWSPSQIPGIATVATTGTYTDIIGRPIISVVNSATVIAALGFTPYNSTNPNNYISSINSVSVIAALGFTPYNATNPSGFISSVPAQSFSSITGKPTTLSGYGITDGTSTARNAMSLTTTGSGAATYNSSTGAWNIPTPSTPTSHTVTRTITTSSGTNTFTINSAQATVYYNVSISCTASIGSASSGTVALQYSTDNGSTWITLQETINSNTITLALTLNAVTIQCVTISAVIPAGALVQLLQTTTGTTTITYKRGQEIY